MERIDISEFGSDVYSVTGVGNILYFAPSVNSQDTFNQVVYAYNISTEEISAIKFPEDVFHIVNMDDKLYVTHGNLVTGEGTTLSVYTTDIGEINTYDLNMWPGQITIKDNALYVMGADIVAKFDLQTLDKQAEASIPLNDGYYLSNIFQIEIMIVYHMEMKSKCKWISCVSTRKSMELFCRGSYPKGEIRG